MLATYKPDVADTGHISADTDADPDFRYLKKNILTKSVYMKKLSTFFSFLFSSVL